MPPKCSPFPATKLGCAWPSPVGSRGGNGKTDGDLLKQVPPNEWKRRRATRPKDECLGCMKNSAL